jgi:hypothetical protein
VYDQNDTLTKIRTGLPDFVEKYTGKDLFHTATKEAEKMYLRKLKNLSRRSEIGKAMLDNVQYHCIRQPGLKMKIKKQKVAPALPWNGWSGGIEMTITCTADNMLYFAHVLQIEREDITAKFKSSTEPALNLLYQVHQCFFQDKFPEGKHLWLDQFFNSDLDVWDAYGAEEDYSFSKLPVLNTYTSACSKPESCAEPVKIFQSNMIGYNHRRTGAKGLGDGVQRWIENKGQSICGRKVRDSDMRMCDGLRTTSPRVFVAEIPCILPIEVAASPWPTLTPKLKICNTGFSLQMVTYASGGHFCASIKIKGEWWLYDGLKEYHRPGSGLQRQPCPIPPQGYSRNTCVYVTDFMS